MGVYFKTKFNPPQRVKTLKCEKLPFLEGKEGVVVDVTNPLAGDLSYQVFFEKYGESHWFPEEDLVSIESPLEALKARLLKENPDLIKKVAPPVLEEQNAPEQEQEGV